MKIRSAFVANSSSTSFIVAYKTPGGNPCPTCGRKDVSFIEIIKKHVDYREETKVIAEGYEEVLKYLKENDWFVTKEEFPKVIKEIKSCKKGNEDVAVLSISYHDEEMSELMQDNSRIIHCVG